QEPNIRLRQRMHRLNRIEVTTAYPFLLSLYDDYTSGAISPEDLQEILDLLENFLIRRFVCGIGTNQLNKLFPGLYLQASHSGNIVGGVREFLRTKGYPKDPEFRERLISSKLYGAGDRIQKTKLILERIEASFGHKESVALQNLTIEHVMPQTLTEWWKENLGPNWEIIHETLVDTLGNLTLTAYNSALSNADINHKSRILNESHLELNKEFMNVTRWDEAAIRRRAELLAERALNIWRYFGPASDIEEPQEINDVTGKTPTAVTILGERFAVSSWRDVAQITMETIATLDEDRINEILTQFPRLIGRDQSRFRSTRQLSNGLFIEVHMSAAAIYRFCVQAAELADLSSEDWRLELDGS
ncbi:MAG: HNH endonuclease family protein, partial [Thermomicrobiales bacterium]